MDLNSDLDIIQDTKPKKLNTIVEKRDISLDQIREKEKLVKNDSALDSSPTLDSDKIVVFEDVQYLQPKVRQILRVFGKDLVQSLLCEPKYDCKSFMSKLNGLSFLSISEIEKLCLYFFGCSNTESSTTLTNTELTTRLKDFSGDFTHLNLSIFEEISMSLEFVDGETDKHKLIKYFKDLSKCEIVTLLDIFSINSYTGLEVDQLCISRYLLEKSQSLSVISLDVVKQFTADLEVHLDVSNLSPAIKTNKMTKSVSNKVHGKMHTDFGPSPDQIVEKGQRLFLKLADFLFDNDSTLYKIIHPVIFDKVIDGKEHQLVKLDHFYEILEDHGFTLASQDKFCIEHLVKPVFRDIVDVQDIRYTFLILTAT